MPRALANEARSAYEAVDRGLVLLALVWQALWIGGDAELWRSELGSGILGPRMWAVLATWLLLLAWRVFDIGFLRWPARWANVVALAACAFTLLPEAASKAAPDWGPASNLVLLSACMGGLLLRPLAGSAWIAFIVSVETVVILGIVDPGIEPSRTDVLYPLYALSLGVVLVTARYVLCRDARRTDRAADDLFEAEGERLTAEGVESALRRQERHLHETVLNTLTAIVRGGITSTDALRDRLRVRCRESVGVLEQIGRQVQSSAGPPNGRRLDQDLLPVLVELEATGVHVDVSCDELAGIPDEVYDAVRTAVREALSNVLRHAHATRVSLVVHRDDASVPSLEAVVRDDGVGFPMTASYGGFGIRQAVIEALGDVGGFATVSSTPQQGTTVRISWREPASLDEVEVHRSVAAAAFAIPLLISFGLFNLLVVVLTWPDVSDSAAAVGSLSIFLALSVLIAITSLRGSIPWWVVIIVAAGSALLYRVQTDSVADAQGDWSAWSSAAVVALFVVAAGAGPGWSWVLLLVTWLVIQGDILHELLAAGTAMIVSAALFGRDIRANELAVDRRRRLLLEERTALAVSEEASQGIRRRYRTLDASGVRDLLTGLADGVLDPEDEGVRRWAALEERYIRTVMRVDPALDGVRALAIELAGIARERGLFLDVDLTADPPPPRLPRASDALALRWAVEKSSPGGVARLSARMEGSEYVLRLVTPIPLDQHLQAEAPLRKGMILDPADRDMLWEIRGVRGESHDRSDQDATASVGDHR